MKSLRVTRHERTNAPQQTTQKERPPRGGLSPKAIRCFDQAASAAAFRFLRQPSRPNAPRP